MDDSGCSDLGGDPVDAADDALRCEGTPLAALRVQAFDPTVEKRTLQRVEIPVRNAGRRRQHGGVRSEQRSNAVERGRHLMRLEGDDDEVLDAQIRCVVASDNARAHFATRRFDHQALAPDGSQVLAASDHADFDAVVLRQVGREIATDRADAENADLHEGLG